MVTIPNIETLDSLYMDTVDPWGYIYKAFNKASTPDALSRQHVPSCATVASASVMPNSELMNSAPAERMLRQST